MSRPIPRFKGGRDVAPLALGLVDTVRGLKLRLDGLAQSIIHGDRLSGFPGRGLEAAGVRAYEQGDEARGIDWRVTARKGQLHVRVFDEERDLPFLILLHRSPTLRGGRSGIKEVRALEVAGLLSAVALGGGDRVGLLQGGVGPGAFLAPSRRKNQLLHLLNGLLSPPPGAVQASLPHLLGIAGKEAVERHRIFLISDFQSWVDPAGDFRNGLASLGGRHALTPVWVTDRREGDFPGPIPLPLQDPSTRRIVRSARGREREGLREALSLEERGLAELFRGLGFPEWRIEVEEPLVPTLRTLMARDRWRGGVCV